MDFTSEELLAFRDYLKKHKGNDKAYQLYLSLAYFYGYPLPEKMHNYFIEEKNGFQDYFEFMHSWYKTTFPYAKTSLESKEKYELENYSEIHIDDTCSKKNPEFTMQNWLGCSEPKMYTDEDIILILNSLITEESKKEPISLLNKLEKFYLMLVDWNTNTIRGDIHHYFITKYPPFEEWIAGYKDRQNKKYNEKIKSLDKLDPSNYKK